MNNRTNHLQQKSGVDTVIPPKQKTRTMRTVRPTSFEIRRDARNQLNVSGGGIPYEKAKSRRTRTRAALDQSGNQEAAVPLGNRRPSLTGRRMSIRASNVDDLEHELQQKSFVRRANISHGCKRLQHLQQQPARKIRMQKRYLKRKLPPRSQNISEPEQKLSFGLSIGTKARKKRLREDNQQHDPEDASRAYAVPQSQSRSRSQSQSQPCGKSAVVNSNRPRTMPQRREKQRRNSQNQPKLKSEPDSETEFKPQMHTPLKVEQNETNRQHEAPVKKSQVEINQQHEVPVKREHQTISNQTEMNIKPETVVIDLLSSDSEDDDECTEDHLVLTLTQLLQNEAIGRGANLKEMQSYARHLFRLGLHSKQMILDALDFNTNTLDNGNYETGANIDMVSGIVNRWEWMKPFHRTIFHRWIRAEQQRQRGTRNRA